MFDATEEVLSVLEYDMPWRYIDEIKEHLLHKSDKQYQEYIRLKAIYEK